MHQYCDNLFTVVGYNNCIEQGQYPCHSTLKIRLPCATGFFFSFGFCFFGFFAGFLSGDGVGDRAHKSITSLTSLSFWRLLYLVSKCWVKLGARIQCKMRQNNSSKHHTSDLRDAFCCVHATAEASPITTFSTDNTAAPVLLGNGRWHVRNAFRAGVGKERNNVG